VTTSSLVKEWICVKCTILLIMFAIKCATWSWTDNETYIKAAFITRLAGMDLKEDQRVRKDTWW